MQRLVLFICIVFAVLTVVGQDASGQPLLAGGYYGGYNCFGDICPATSYGYGVYGSSGYRGGAAFIPSYYRGRGLFFGSGFYGRRAFYGDMVGIGVGFADNERERRHQRGMAQDYYIWQERIRRLEMESRDCFYRDGRKYCRVE